MSNERQAIDATVLSALRTAVAADPANPALRLHYAGLLRTAGEHAAALAEYTTVLAGAPDDLTALDGAAAAADGLADLARAASYRSLSSALKAARQPAPVIELRAIRGGAEAGAEIEKPRLTLADVAGMENVKRRLQLAFLGPLQNPALRHAFAKSLRGGLLLYGPPGCGKTFIARALAGELGAHFIWLGLQDILGMYTGESEKNLHALFEDARRHTPCVLFFDEVDAIGRRRSMLRASGQRELVVQLLAELDSMGSDNEGVFVLAASNHPWDVDSALRRPGRLDRTILVLPPDAAAREAILKANLAERPVGDVGLAALAARTERYSGADLAHVCDTAAEYALEASMGAGKPLPISQAQLERALREVAATTTAWLETARNYAQFANEGGAYDDLLAYFRESR